MVESNRKPKIILADHTFPIEVERRKLAMIQKEMDVEAVVVPNGDRAALLSSLADADVAIMHRAKFDKEALAASPKLGLIIKCGIGVDTIDVPEATARGIYVANDPNSGAIEVAEHTIGLMMALARKICMADRDARRKPFPKTYDLGYAGFRLEGRVFGMIGLGTIGRKVAKLARGLGMDVIAYTPSLTTERAGQSGVRAASQDDVIKQADVLSLHCPLSDRTRNMINAQTLGLMKPTAILVNTGRGLLVDEAALVTALTAGTIAGAAVDVLQQEPCTPDNPLLALPNTIVTPHMAWASPECIEDYEIVAAKQALQFLRKEVPVHLLNRSVLERHPITAIR